MEQEQITPEVEQEPQVKVPEVQQVEIVKKPLLPKYLFTIFILLILGTATWFVYQYVAQDIDVTESEDARIVDSHEEMEQTEVLPNVFDSTIKVGEQYGSMIAREVDTSFGTLAITDKIKVTFVGETKVIGTLRLLEGLPISHSLNSFTEESLKRLPRFDKDTKDVGFGISNTEILNKEELSHGDVVEVVIDEYNYIFYPAGVISLVNVKSIKKVKGLSSAETGIAIEYRDQTNKYIDTKEGFSFEYPNTWTYEVEETEHETSKIVYKKTKFFSTDKEDMMLVRTPVREIGYESAEVKHQTNMLIADSDVEMSITTYKEEYLNPSSQMISWFSEEWNSSVEMFLHEPLVGSEEGRGAAQIRESVRILEKTENNIYTESLKVGDVVAGMEVASIEAFKSEICVDESCVEKKEHPFSLFENSVVTYEGEKKIKGEIVWGEGAPKAMPYFRPDNPEELPHSQKLDRSIAISQEAYDHYGEGSHEITLDRYIINSYPSAIVNYLGIVLPESIKINGNGCDIAGVENGFVVTPDGLRTDIPEFVCSTPDLLIENSTKEFGAEGEAEIVYIYKSPANSAYLIFRSQFDQGNVTDAEYDILPIPDYVNVETLELIAENDRPHIKYLHDGNHLYIVSRFTWMGYSNFVFLSQDGIDKDSFEVLGDTLVRDEKRLFNLKTTRGLYEVVGVDPNEVIVYASHEPVSESLPLTLYRDNKTLRHGTTTIHNISSISSFKYRGLHYGWPSMLDVYFEDDGHFFKYKSRGVRNKDGDRILEGVEEIQENQIPSENNLSVGLYR